LAESKKMTKDINCTLYSTIMTAALLYNSKQSKVYPPSYLNVTPNSPIIILCYINVLD